MDDSDEAQQNMVSNLPLLFANGYPTSLDKISEKALETFIPFMVQCSLGNINTQGRNDISEPEWWPEDVPFSIPLVKPKKFDGNWLDKMKEIVVICYQFHKSIFLLRFCFDLAAYEPTRLRFINNYNSTTSLYDRRCNKLLVTFRNENMTYDQPQKNRKTLLQKSRSQTAENNNNTQQMVEPALFDIYLCDHCDAELYSLEAITEHEKTCIQDDDVIICESPTPDEDEDRIADDVTTNFLDKSNDERREAFLLNFALQSRNIPTSIELPSKLDSPKDQPTKLDDKTIASTKSLLLAKSQEDKFKCVSIVNRRSGRNASNETSNGHPSPEKLEKLKRLPRRNRAVYALSRCPTVPLSSPAGQLMIKSSKTQMTEDYLYERLDRMERFCHTPILSAGVIRPKFMSRKYLLPHSPVTHKKVPNQSVHLYDFPRRQFFNRYRVESFMFLNSLLLKKCRPISIRLKKLNESRYDRRGSSYYLGKRCSERSNSSSSSDCISVRSLPILGIHSNLKLRKSEVVVDTIDLCSSDDEENRLDANLTKDISKIDKISRDEGESKYKLGKHQQAQLISSEITITPISKGLEKEIENIRKKNKFEGNFLVSQSTPTQPPKPLQPSVFLFSNYTTENIHLRHSTGNSNTPDSTTGYSNLSSGNIVVNGCHQSTVSLQTDKKSLNSLKIKDSHDFSNNLQNQENVERNASPVASVRIASSTSSSSASLLKHTSLNTLQNGGANDWLPSLNLTGNYRTDRNNSSTTASTTSSSNGNSNIVAGNKLLQLFTCSADDSGVALNKMNSPPPNRTISIDLTI